MNSWKNIRIKGIARIERAVAEFNIWEIQKTPYGKFKVKIFEEANGGYIGYTNLQVIDVTGSYYAGVGHGDTILEALEDTVNYFLAMLDGKEKWEEADFCYCDPNDY